MGIGRLFNCKLLLKWNRWQLGRAWNCQQRWFVAHWTNTCFVRDWGIPERYLLIIFNKPGIFKIFLFEWGSSSLTKDKFSVEKELDDAVFCERFSANRAVFLRHLTQAFLASWMSAIEDAKVTINCVVFFEADIAFVAPVLFQFLINKVNDVKSDKFTFF